MLLQIFCALSIWSLIGVGIWQLPKTLLAGFQQIWKLHQVPCDRCIYFTGDYRLKCAVNPLKAMTEEALICGDFAFKPSSKKRNKPIKIK